MRKYVLIWFCVLFYLVPIIGNAQEKERDNFVHYHLRYFHFVNFNDPEEINKYNEPYDFQEKTSLRGVNFSVNYNVLNRLSFGIGTGWESIKKPDISYIPILLRIAANSGVRENSIHVEVNLGGHYNLHSKKGFMARYILGYRFRVFHTLFMDVDMFYTIQNIYKHFEGSIRYKNMYRYSNIGLAVGISFN